MLERFLGNHVLANITFVLVIVMGVTAHSLMPRQQDPTVNFNWIEIITTLPGAAPEDIERRVTDPIERGLRRIDDTRFVTSTSSEGVSRILVRFRDIEDSIFRERVADLRREIQSAEDELPDDADDPRIVEITSANAFPAATLAVVADGDGENLRRAAVRVERDIERMDGVDNLLLTGMQDPEMHVEFDPAAVEALGVAPGELADSVRGYFRDLAGGQENVGDQSWLVRVDGTSSDPAVLGALPIVSAAGEIPLDAVAEVSRGRSEADSLARFRGRPAVIVSVNKQAEANTLDLVDRLEAYIAQANAISDRTGVELVLADDQTQVTRDALDVMQRNMLIGLILVMAVAWLFLGGPIALILGIAIPFILAGTFWVLWLAGETLNVTVLLGVVIALGMLVDDAVVVVEAIHYRIERGARSLRAAVDGLREVFAPVTTAVATTIAAFVPLMLMPGVLGQFMYVVPFVVTTALLMSLVEAYWMLPAHVLGASGRIQRPGRARRIRARCLWRLRIIYTRLLVRVMRRPRLLLGGALALFAVAVTAVATERGVRWDFFAFDPLPLFYVNVELPAGTPVESTLATTLEVEERTRALLRPDEARAVVAYAGRMFTDTELLRGDHYGQLLVALNPRDGEQRRATAIVDALRGALGDIPGAEVSLLHLSGGPPATRPVSVKVRGDDYAGIRAAAADLRALMEQHPHIEDVADDDEAGTMQLDVRVDASAAHRAGVAPSTVARTVRLMVDGEIVTSFQDLGEERDVRVRARRDGVDAIDEILDIALPGEGGSPVPLTSLVDIDRGPGLANIRHHDFRRAITVDADIDRERIDAVAANAAIREQWRDIRGRHPDVALDFSGLLDDIQESLDSMLVLGLFGIGLVYLILGTQFRSYFQPLMILVTVPMAFTGVVAGLVVTGNPISLFTLYGVIALAGLAVNAAIVMVSTMNARLDRGMPILHATLYGARRRVVPILVTSTTTIAGLFSLATGLGGESLLWGPVATAIVWGLGVSTVLTLFVVPTLYGLTMRRSWRRAPQP